MKVIPIWYYWNNSCFFFKVMRFWYYHATLLKEIQLLDLKHGLESNTVLVLLRQRRFLFGSDLKGKRTWKYNFGIKLTTNMILEKAIGYYCNNDWMFKGNAMLEIEFWYRSNEERAFKVIPIWYY